MRLVLIRHRLNASGNDCEYCFHLICFALMLACAILVDLI